MLKVLLATAAQDAGQRVTKAVISVRPTSCLHATLCQGLTGRWAMQVPAYFDAAQRAATERAGQLAGLEVVRLIRCTPALVTGAALCAICDALRALEQPPERHCRP